VAGDVNRVREEREYRDKMLRAARPSDGRQRLSSGKKSFFEYHSYTLQRQATNKRKPTKQITLINADGCP